MNIVNLLKKISITSLKKCILFLGKNGIRETFELFFKQYEDYDREYEEWYKAHKLKKADIETQKRYHFTYEPLISILVPVFNTPLLFLQEMIASVCEQTYSNWELCIANASSDNLDILDFLNKCVEKDSRIRVVIMQENLGIAGNTNEVLHIAKGDYVGLLDHDDVLSKDALFEVVKTINEKGMPEILYSDEDKIDEERYFQPNFKPDFNLDLLRSNNYICHFFVAKRSLIMKIGGFRDNYNGAQDYDLILRSIEKTDRIEHIPKILYHWRIHNASTAENPESKKYAYIAGKRAIQGHLMRCGEYGKVGFTQDMGFYRVKYVVKGAPLLSIIVLCKNGIRESGIQSICRSNYKNLEIFIVGYNITLKNIPNHMKIFNIDKNVNPFLCINSIVKYAKGQYLLLVSGDIKMVDYFCIDELLANCQREKVGIVGGKIYSRGGRIQNAGIIVRGDEFAENIFQGKSKYYVGYMHRESLQQNLSAVSVDCMMIKRQVFDAVKGFDEKAGSTFASTDFCLRVREKGFLIVFNPNARFICLKRDNKKNKYSQSELEYMKGRWKAFLKDGDPAYNPNLASKYLLDKNAF